jgi:Sporulation and spore germination
MKPSLSLALVAVLFLSACNATFGIGVEHSPDPEVLAIVLPTATVAVVPPSPTQALPSPAAPIPTVTPMPVVATDAPTATAVPAVTSTGPQYVQIYLIAIEDNGQSGLAVGCGDSAVPVQVEIPHTQGVLRAALNSLLSIKDQYYGGSGLYNALYQSDLQVESVKIENGKATVSLTGTLLLGGECDNPRVQAQLEQTVRQFSTVTEVEIFINGRPLADVLSLKG